MGHRYKTERSKERLFLCGDLKQSNCVLCVGEAKSFSLNMRTCSNISKRCTDPIRIDKAKPVPVRLHIEIKYLNTKEKPLARTSQAALLQAVDACVCPDTLFRLYAWDNSLM